MKWIKIIWYFLIAFIGMCIIGFFGSLGICAVKEIFSYLFTHCKEIMVHTIIFVFGLIGVVIGWGVFCDGVDRLKDS